MEIILITIVSTICAVIYVSVVSKLIGEDTCEGTYECSNCHYKFQPSKIKLFLAIHSDNERIFKCINCGKRHWFKKI